jgi:hypothetical protein
MSEKSSVLLEILRELKTLLKSLIPYITGLYHGGKNEKAKQAQKNLDMAARARSVRRKTANDARRLGELREKYSRRRD